MPSDRLIGSLEAIIAALLPQLAFYAQWQARVVDATQGPPVLISCAPTSTTGVQLLGPLLSNVTLWPGPDGGYGLPLPGTLVRIGFIDASPANPAILGLDPNSVPETITMGAPTAAPVVPAPWALELTIALATFASGLTPTSLAAQAAALVTSLQALPSPATINLLAS